MYARSLKQGHLMTIREKLITQFVNKKTNLFINLPTGYGKLRVYLALMEDQVDKSKINR